MLKTLTIKRRIWKAQIVSPVTVLVVSFLSAFAAASCTAPMVARQDPAGMRPAVILQFHRDAYRARILMEDLPVQVVISRPDPVPYSENASAAVWVGTEFPYEQAVEAVLISKKYYPQLRYFALSDYRLAKAPLSVHRELYIGGSTDTAVRLKLSAWNDSDFASLKKIRSKEEFHSLIRSKYPQAGADKKN